MLFADFYKLLISGITCKCNFFILFLKLNLCWLEFDLLQLYTDRWHCLRSVRLRVWVRLEAAVNNYSLGCSFGGVDLNITKLIHNLIKYCKKNKIQLVIRGYFYVETTVVI